MTATKKPAKKRAARKRAAPTAATKRAAAKRRAAAAPRKAAPPGVYDPRAAFEAVQDKQYPAFPFLGWDGEEVFHLPNPLTLDPVDIRIALGLDPDIDFEPEDLDALDQSAVFTLLETMVPDAWGAMTKMPLAVRAEVLSAWTDFITEQVGDEGKAQSESSAPNRAARRSKQT